MRKLSTGTWVGDCCPLSCDVEGSDMATVLIGDGDQNVELVLSAEGMRKLVTATTQAMAEMDALFAREVTA